jgi:hypothetical protein
MNVIERIESAYTEARVIGKLLGLVRGRASGHGDVDIENVEVVGTTLVYQRNGKTFHLVVHDMTGQVTQP